MGTDYYVNVGGKKVLYSTLSPTLQKQLDDYGVTATETERQDVGSSYAGTTGVRTDPAYREFVERDHVVERDGKRVSVPGRFAERAGIKPPPVKRKKRKSKKEELEEEKRKAEEEPKFRLGNEEKSYSQLSGTQQRQYLRFSDPLALAKAGILAPSDNIFFKTTKTTKDPKTGKVTKRLESSPTLERNFKAYILKGDVSGINAYLEEIYETQGPRAAFKERERLIKAGVEGTALEGARQAGGVGTRKQRKEKEAKERRSAQVLRSGQAELAEAKYGPLIKGELGATFDERTQPKTIITLDGKEQVLDPSGKAVIDFAARTTTPSLLAPEIFKQVVKEKGITLTPQGEQLIELYTTQPEQFSFIRSGIITDKQTGEKYDPTTGQGSQKISKALTKPQSIQLMELPKYADLYSSKPERQGPPKPEYYIGFVDGKPAFTSDLKPAEEAGWRKPYSAFGKPIEELVSVTDKVRTTVTENKWVNLLPLGPFGAPAVIEAGTQAVADTANIDNLLEQTKGSLKRSEWKYVPEFGTVVFQPGKFESQHKTIDPPVTLTDTVIKGISEGKTQSEVISELGGYTQKYGVGTVGGAALPFLIMPYKQIGKGVTALSPLKKLTVPIVGARGNINLVTKLQLGYSTKRIDLIGKYGEGGKYFWGKTDPSKTAIKQIEGPTGKSSFETFELKDYNPAQIRELGGIMSYAEKQGILEKGSFATVVREGETLTKATKLPFQYEKVAKIKEFELTEGVKGKEIGSKIADLQKKGLLEQEKGSGIVNKLKDDILTKKHDIDITAETVEKGITAAEELVKIGAKEGYVLGRRKTNVFIARADPTNPLKPLKGTEKDLINIVTPADERVSAIKGLQTDKFYGKKIKTDEIQQTVEGTKKKIKSQDFPQQIIDWGSSTSGIVSSRTIKAFSGATHSLEKTLLGGHQIRVGLPLIHRASKDIGRSYFWGMRVSAKTAWQSGKKDLARELGLAMKTRYEREAKWLDWRKTLSELKKEPIEIIPTTKAEKIQSIASMISSKPQPYILPTTQTSSLISPRTTKKPRTIELVSVKSIKKPTSTKSILSPKSAKSITSPTIIKSMFFPTSTKSITSTKSAKSSTSTKSLTSPKSITSPKNAKSLASPKYITSPKSVKSPLLESPKSPKPSLSLKSRLPITSKPPTSITSKPPTSKPPISYSSLLPPPTKTPPSKTPPPVVFDFQLKEKKKKRKKKAGDDTEEFLGSTYESSVFGFRSKKFDITYKKKSISRLLGEEKKKFKRPKYKPRGKTPLAKKTPKRAPSDSLTGGSKVKFF